MIATFTLVINPARIIAQSHTTDEGFDRKILQGLAEATGIYMIQDSVYDPATDVILQSESVSFDVQNGRFEYKSETIPDSSEREQAGQNVLFRLFFDGSSYLYTTKTNDKGWSPFDRETSFYSDKVAQLLSHSNTETELHFGRMIRMMQKRLEEIDQSSEEGKSRALTYGRFIAQRMNLAASVGDVALRHNGEDYLYRIEPKGFISRITRQKDGFIVGKTSIRHVDGELAVPVQMESLKAVKRLSTFGFASKRMEDGSRLVVRVFKGSAAEDAGIREGFEWVSMNDRKVGEEADTILRELIRTSDVGIFEFRDQMKNSVRVTLKKS